MVTYLLPSTCVNSPMKTTFLLLIACFGVSLLEAQESVSAPQPTPEDSQVAPASTLEKGEIKAYKAVGDVGIYDAEDNRIGDLKSGEILEHGSVLVTGEKSNALLMFSNGSSINVGANSKVEFAVFLQAPFDPIKGRYATLKADPSTSKAHLFVHYGEVLGTVKKLQHTSVFDVETPVGTASVRGTTFFVSYGLDETNENYMMQIGNFDGEVIVESSFDAELVMSDGGVAAATYNPYSGPRLYQIPPKALVLIAASRDFGFPLASEMPQQPIFTQFADFFTTQRVQGMLEAINAINGAKVWPIFTPQDSPVKDEVNQDLPLDNPDLPLSP